MLIGVPTETLAGERRVALVPEVVRKLAARGAEVVVEAGAGAGAIIPDELYAQAGASVSADGAAVWGTPLLVKVSPPTDAEISRMARGAVIVAFLNPLGSPQTTRALAAAGLTAFAMESIPRMRSPRSRTSPAIARRCSPPSTSGASFPCS
jgi:NAD(P) transhydrogenase subunit alpha